MLRERGYSTERFKVLESGYYNKTTKLQRASYDVYIVGLVKSGNAKKLGSVLSSGIAPNPANTFGESILRTSSRRRRVVPHCCDDYCCCNGGKVYFLFVVRETVCSFDRQKARHFIAHALTHMVCCILVVFKW